MNANKIAKDLEREGKFPGHICYGTSPLLIRAANMLKKQQEQIDKLTAIVALREMQIKEVMSENCTCYKLGYSPLNDYATVKQK